MASFSWHDAVAAEVRERRNRATQLRSMRADVGGLDAFGFAPTPAVAGLPRPVTFQGLQARILFQ
jgi:hypothetical protein